MKKVILLLICVLLIVFSCDNIKKYPSSAYSESDSLLNKIDGIFKDWKYPDSPGGSVAIVKGNKVLFIKGYGCADIEMSVPVTPQTRFYLASISKQFTGYCIAKLIYEHKLSLDDDIKKYLPELASINAPLKIRDLVYQKSGLRDIYGLIPLKRTHLNDYFSNNDALYILCHQRELNFSPGDKWEYSNTNYFLLGEIVKRITGESLKHWTEKTVFMPLKMNNTFFVDSIETIVPNKAKSYYQNNNGAFFNDPFLDVMVGHTGLYSTAEDMAKWLIHLSDMYKKGDPVFELMLQPDTLNSGEKLTNYSFGLFKSYGNATNYWHRGSLFGYKSIISYYPDRDFGLVILGNVQRFNRIRYAREITQIFYPEINNVTSESQTVFSIADSLKTKSFVLDPDLLKKYTGNYVVNPMLIYVISRHNDSLFLNEYGESELTYLINTGKNIFRDENGSIQISFYETGKGRIDSLMYQSASDNVTGIKAEQLSSKQELVYTGNYYNDELDITINIEKSPTGLIAQNWNLGLIELIHTFTDEFRCNHDFFSYISFYRDGNNNIKGFLMDGFSVSNIRFVKK